MPPCPTCGHDCGGYGCHIPDEGHAHGLGCLQRVIADDQERADERGALLIWIDGLSRDDYEGDPRDLAQSAFHAAWQARGAYERQHVSLELRHLRQSFAVAREALRNYYPDRDNPAALIDRIERAWMACEAALAMVVAPEEEQ